VLGLDLVLLAAANIGDNAQPGSMRKRIMDAKKRSKYWAQFVTVQGTV